MSYERTDRAGQRRSRILRWGILGLILVLFTAVVTAHQYVSGAGKPVGVDALCPFGGLETLFTLVSGAGFIEKTAASAVVLLAGIIGLTLLFRRSFCGQLCPLGALQGVFGSIGGKFIKRRREVPAKIDRIARFLKYGVLVFFIIWTWQAAELVMRPYDPWVAFTHLTSAELFTEFAVGVAVLVLALLGSIMYERFFCKYLCPTGAFLGIFSKISLFGIKRDADACINCGICDKACPMNVSVSDVDQVTASECISCNECVNSCPVAGALEVKGPKGKSVKPVFMTALVTAAILVVIGVSVAAGVFALQMPSLGEAAAEQAEGFDTSLVKGYMSLAEISEASGLPEELFIERWGVPESDMDEPMKDIKDVYEFSPDDVKVWVDEELAR